MANIIVRPRNTLALPDNDRFTNRFEIHSETSDRVYVIAQHKTCRWWGCSCFGWIRNKHCKHLETLGIPSNHQPYEALLK